MAQNTQPIYPLVPQVSVGKTLTTANTAKDGTGTVVTLLTAGANGSRVDKVTVVNTGTAVQTVLRLFVNNGATNATATNNSYYREVTIPAYTLSETTGQIGTTFTLDLALPAGYTLNATIGTTVATALSVTCEGGDY